MCAFSAAAHAFVMFVCFSYLNELARITSPKYLPSEDDVLRARLKTVGVSEYRFQMESGYETGTEWRIIDVGGSRGQRRKCAISTRLHLS